MTDKITTSQPAARAASADFLIPDVATLVLSIVLALAVWWIAIDQENPLIVQDLGERVPVSVLGLGEDLVIVEDLSSEAVRLRLRAPRNSWQDLTVSDFRATLDLTNLGPGQHDVAVQVKSLDPQVGILDVQRPQLRVTLDTLSAKEVPVEVEIMDTSAFGYDAQPAVYRPVTVTVSGPASQVQQVVRARTEIFLRGAKNQVERMEEVTPVNTQGEAVTRVTTEPAQVQVVVPVEQWPGRKEVAVRVKLQGGPADGYRLSSVKVDPSTVVLQGNTEVLASVPGYVETEPLTLDGATADVRLRLALLLPDGVTSFDGDTVVATAGITPIEGGVTISQPLVQRGLAPGLSAQSALQAVDVILSGPLPLLDSLNQDDVFAILDLSGLISGTHTLQPQVVLPDGISLQSVIPERVEVVITPDAGMNAAAGAVAPSAAPSEPSSETPGEGPPDAADDTPPGAGGEAPNAAPAFTIPLTSTGNFGGTALPPTPTARPTQNP
jgi:YbbR domain-containing protein